MPFAQWHAPFENEDTFEDRFPADYICEALDQTRGWFYSLLAVSTLLFGRASFETVLCLGLITDPQGQKMSKSRGNAVAPWDVLDTHGADAFRWYYFTSKQPWDGYRFSVETIGESVRQYLKTLWNTYGFFALYANANDVDARLAGRGRADRPGPVGAVAPAVAQRHLHRPPGRLRHHHRRARHPGLRRRALQLVRAPLPAPLLGRRPRRLRHPARVPARRGQADRAADPVRGRRHLRGPGRLASRRCTCATTPSPTPPCATSGWSGRWAWPAKRSASGARPAPTGG